MIERIPPKIASLDEVAPNMAICYQPAADGGFELKQAAVDWYDAADAKDAAVDQLRGQVRALAITQALQNAIIPRLACAEHVRSVVALLSQRLQFDVVEQSGDLFAYARSPFGHVSVDSAVETWLSVEGQAFAKPTDASRGDGAFTTAIRGLGATH